MMKTVGHSVPTGETAAQILLALLKTPQLIKLHFEFDVSTDNVPYVQYTVNRFAIETPDKEGDTA